MQLRPFLPEIDHATVSAWWAAHNWPAVPKELLTTDGFVAVDDDGTLLAAGWLFVADAAPLAMMEWLVSNPDIKPRAAMRALEAIVDAALGSARRSGVRAVFTFCKQQALSRLYQRHGFQKGDEGVTSLVCSLS